MSKDLDPLEFSYERLTEAVGVLESLVRSAGTTSPEAAAASASAHKLIKDFVRFQWTEVSDFNNWFPFPTYRKERLANVEIERESVLPSLTPRPTFLIGTWRSGTTLTSALIDTHPEFAAVPENELIPAILNPRLDALVGHLAPDPIRMSPVVWAHKTVEELGETRDSLFRRYASLIHGVFQDYTLRRGKKRWLAKFIGLQRFLDLLDMLFDYDARYLFIVRHGLDNALSCSEFLGRTTGSPQVVHGSLDVRTYLEHWVDMAERTMDFCERNAERCHVFRYEDLVAAPSETAERIFQFLGVPHDPRILDELQKHTPSSLRGDTKLFEQGAGIDPSRTQRWRGWPTPLLQQLGRVADDTLVRMGYEPIKAVLDDASRGRSSP